MKKCLILLFVVLLSVCSVKAQIHGGVKGGLTMAKMNLDLPSGLNSVMKLGFYGGGFLVIGKGLFRFQPELLYVQKGVTVDSTGTLAYARGTYNYLELPLTARIVIGINKVNVYFNVGGYAGYWLNGKTTTYAPNIQTASYETTTETYTFHDDYDNRFDAGLVFGVGVKVLFFFVEGRYSMGLVNSRKEGPQKDNSKLSYFGVALGVQF